MRSLITVLIALLSLGGAFAQMQELEKGQVWTFEDATTPDARIVIGDVEPLWGGESVAVSISIINLPLVELPNGELGGSSIGHLPFDIDVLRANLVTLESLGGNLDENYDEGYTYCKQAIEAGEAGVFTITVAETIEFVRNTMLGEV